MLRRELSTSPCWLFSQLHNAHVVWVLLLPWLTLVDPIDPFIILALDDVCVD